MKLSLFVTPLTLLFLTGCTPENESPGSGDVSFSLEMLSDTQGGREMQSLPPGSYLQISIETAAGEETLTNHQLPILTFAGTFASQPLELPEGDYVLTEFLVISAENEVLYATPMAGSPLAGLVDEPLPIAFTVTVGAGTQVNLQVINVAMLTPEDVGYVTFPFTIVSHFFLTVFEGGQALTDATGYIVQGNDTLKTFTILPEINTVSFVGDNAEEFNLVIVKSGYGKHSQSFTIQGIIDDYASGIVPVTLAPALTFVAVGFDYGSSYPYSFAFDVDFEGNLTIDWGDGTIEDVVDGDDVYLHEFQKQQDYFVSVTGDIDNIVSFYSYYGGGPMNAIDVTNLPELMDFRNGYNGSSPSPSIIDLSQNPKLVYVDVSISESLEELILPENGKISGLVMQAPNGLTPADLEGIITTLYNAAVASMRYDGYIDLQSPVDGAVTGPPTEATLEMLRSLRDTYNWSITPDPE